LSGCVGGPDPPECIRYLLLDWNFLGNADDPSTHRPKQDAFALFDRVYRLARGIGLADGFAHSIRSLVWAVRELYFK
jgi:hypothetical protein